MLPAYLDYKGQFGDLAKIPEGAFDLFLQRAVAEINQLITEKVENLQSDQASLCILEVADFLYENKERDGIISENIDGYSVTYGERTESVSRIVKRYLSAYMYRGVEL